MSALFIAASVVAVGVLLLALGLRGRRVDDTPHCRRCRYNLTGLTAQQCPECGTLLDHRAVVWGHRRRRSAFIVGGATALLFGLAAGSFLLRGVRWVQHYPLPLVTALARSGAIDAIGELERRYLRGELSKPQIGRLADLCLDSQVEVAASPRLVAWIDLLDLLDLSRELTPARQQRYYEQIIGELSLEGRPRIREGEPLLFLLSRRGRAPTRSPAVFATKSRVQISDQDHPAERLQVIFENRDGLARGHTTFHLAASAKPGEYPVTYTVTVGLFRAGGLTDEPLSSKTATHTNSLTVVAADHTEEVRLVRDPVLGQRLSQVFNAQSSAALYSWRWSSMPGQASAASVRLAPDQAMPVSVAFTILVRNGVEEQEVGYWYGWKGSPMGFGELAYDAQEARSYDPMLVLRTDLDVARRTVGLEEIWDGEILLGPLRSRRSGTHWIPDYRYPPPTP